MKNKALLSEQDIENLLETQDHFPELCQQILRSPWFICSFIVMILFLVIVPVIQTFLMVY